MKKSKLMATLVIAATLFSMNTAAASAAETTSNKTANTAVSAETSSTVKGKVIEGTNGYSYRCDENGRVHEMYNGKDIGDVADRFISDKDGQWYFVGKDGVILTGMFIGHDSINISGKYFADENGVIQKDKIVKYNGKKYLCSQNGEIASIAARWSLSNGKTYQVDKDGVVLCNQKFKDIDGKYYYLDSEGQKLVSTYKYADGTKYFIDENGVIQTGLIDGSKWGFEQKFFAKEDGILGYEEIVTDKNGKMYYCEYNGTITTNEYIRIGDKNLLYYCGEDGVIQTGVFTNNKGEKCYAARNGIIPEDAGKVTAEGGKMYYVQSMGAIVVDSVIPCGSFTYDKYNIDKDGVIRVGFSKDRFGNIYYSDKDGVTERNKMITDDLGKMYYCKEDGVIGRNEYMHIKKDEKDNLYYADDNGVIQTTFFINNKGEKCYAARDGRIPENAGKITAEDGKMYYVGSNGVLIVDSLASPYELRGNSYNIDKDGVIRVGLAESSDGNLYYSDKDGIVQCSKMVTAENGKMYYCGEYNGAIARNKYIRMGEDQKYALYYADKNGVIQTGFFTNNEGQKCYAAKDGKIPEEAGKITAEDGRMYYIGSMGQVITNCVEASSNVGAGKCYHLDKDGAVKTGFFRDDNGKLYYADKDGVAYNYKVVTAEDGKQYVCLYYGEIPEEAGEYTVYYDGEKTYEVDNHGVVLREVK